MNKLFPILLLLLSMCFISCESSDTLVEDPISPMISLENESIIEVVGVNSIFYFEQIITHTDTIAEVRWSINEKERTDDYKFTKIAGKFFNKKIIDFSTDPLVLLDGSKEAIKPGLYSVDIMAIDINGNSSTENLTLKIIASQNDTTSSTNNSFSYIDKNFKISRIQHSIQNIGASNESVQLQICSENTSLSKSFLSKGSVVWIGLNMSNSDFNQLEEETFTLNTTLINTDIYLNKNIPGEEFTNVPTSKGTIYIKRINTTYVEISFDINPNDSNNHVFGEASGELVFLQ